MVAASIKVLHHIAEGRIVYIGYMVLVTDVRDTLHGIFIETVERKRFYFQFLASSFNLIYFLFNAHSFVTL